MSDHVLVPLADGRWLGLSPDEFREALRVGAEVIGAPKPLAPSESEALMDSEQLARALNLPVTWLEQAARERRIPSIEAGRWRRFSRRAVEAALATHAGRARGAA